MSERDANVADLQRPTGQLVASLGQLRGAGGPATLKHIERMLEGRLYAHLHAGAAHAERQQDGGGRRCGGRCRRWRRSLKADDRGAVDADVGAGVG